jgi:diaminopimelate epimerase
MGIAFAKYEGLGNDFVIISGPAAAAISAVGARALFDRHRGVGADGVLLVTGTPSSPRMQVINADGSQPEMCGNGLRCVALYLVDTGVFQAGQRFTVETDSGPHACFVHNRAAHNASNGDVAVEVSMRAPSLVPNEVPVLGGGVLLDEPFEVAGTQVKLSCISMGNPHGVTFDDLGEGAREKLGPLLEKHARFPRGANIGFARVLGPGRLSLSVWERGVGFTQACGTGACACAVAAVETGRLPRDQPIEVALPGGSLVIRMGERGERITMTGPTCHVFDGTLEL